MFKPGRTAATVNETTSSQEHPSYVLAGRRLTLPSWRTLGIAVAAVLALALVSGGVWFWNASQQQRGSAVYAETLTRHRAAEAPQATPEVRAAAIRELERVLADYPANLMAPQAAYVLGNLRFSSGQYPGARAAYQVAAARASSGTLLTLSRAGVGYSWEAERRFSDAARAFESTLADLKPTSFYYEELLADVARAHELAGHKDAAIAAYRRFLKDLPKSARVPEVKTRLASLGATP